ncbi:MAG TPA: ROK family transcriptional regulator [Streptosporangiaceae bacterium]|jgi:predicted NBD/HSP70 family sugar kinase|nr:ROK family transcriptional regulator [Streptosporangiaceae bacterium]
MSAVGAASGVTPGRSGRAGPQARLGPATANDSPQQLVRRENARRVFHFIRQGEAISRVALVGVTGLSAQAIGDIIRSLIEQGLIEETGAEPRPGLGRHPIGVRVRPHGALAFGCNIERDRIDGAWIDLSGAPVVSEVLRYPLGEEPQRTIGRVEDLYARLSDQLGTVPGEADPRLPAIGLGMPGPIESQSQRLVNPPNLPHWEGVEPRALFSPAWTLPVFLDNAATAAALGEAWQSRNELRSFLYCHWGVGIGGGLVLDLQTYRGETGNAVELGHVPVVPDGAPCGCGGAGCLEAEASVAAIGRQAAGLGFEPDFDRIVALAPAEPALAALLDRAGELLAQALLGAINLLDVDTVVLGGHHLQQAAGWLVEPVRRTLRDRPMRREVRPVTVVCSALGEAAGAVGAASTVFDRLLPSPRVAS